MVAAASCAGTAAADRILDLETGLLYDSNLNNAGLARDIRSDSAATAALSVGQYRQLDQNHSLALTLDLKGEAYRRYSGMSNVAAGITLSARRKLDIGPEAPWLRLSASAARLDYNDNVRDGWRYRAGVSGGKRFAGRWDMRAGYGFEWRTGDHAVPSGNRLPGDVFNLNSRELTMDVHYSFSEKTLLYAGYAHRNGDVVSTSAPNAGIFRGSTAITRDPLFGPNARAYRLDALSHTASVGVSHALGSHASLNLGYQRQITHGAADNNYYKNAFTAAYMHSF